MDTSFDRKKGGKEEWLTPPGIIKALGRFDLDPCSPINRPWDTADKHYTVLDDGLIQSWSGRVFCNPPYGKKTGQWLQKCAEHGNAIVLIFARTETQMFFDHVWYKAHGILFIRNRIKFHHLDGDRKPWNAGSPSCLIAYGRDNARSLILSGISGKFIHLP
jgi:hypothetical protein